MEYTDSFGTPIQEGDFVVFSYSHQNGNTSLTKAQVQSFTKGGNPRVAVFGWIWDREARTSHKGFKTKAVTGFCAKAFDNKGSEQSKDL